MEKIELQTGMPPEKQMLHCQGKDLEKGCTLKDQNIKFGSAINLNFRLGASGVTSISSFFKKGTSSNETSKHPPPNDSNLGEQILTLGYGYLPYPNLTFLLQQATRAHLIPHTIGRILLQLLQS